MKILYTLSIEESDLRSLKELGYTIYLTRESGPFTQEHLSADILVTYDAFAHLDISSMPNLTLIQLGSTGFNHVPQEVIDRGIKVANNPKGFAIPIGEWIVAKILESYKNTRKVYQQQAQQIWKQDADIDELYGKSVLFIGTGNIAKEGAKRLSAFGVDIFGVNRSGKSSEFFSKILSFEELEGEIENFDIIVVVLPGTDKTEKLIDRSLIEKMKEGAVFINISRGSVIDQRALEEMASKFRAVHLDVFEVEPLPEDHPFWKMENVYVSSHTSFRSSQVDRRRFENIYDNLKSFIKGDALPSEVDMRRGY
ncbi:MAG: dihydrofolate reductase [Tissierellia bacterium]|nr:dihydrofolate reductase [Tissierellia bacterium]